MICKNKGIAIAGAAFIGLKGIGERKNREY
jgi:hypothetical protein